ncbi:MAG: hypothetical protein ACUVQ1_03300 [Candidatus Kapaibacteriales bacterium]
MQKNKLLIFVIAIFCLIRPIQSEGKDCFPNPPNPELIFNGSFELGLRGFRTTYDQNYIKFSKNIKVTSNPYNEYYTFDSCSDPIKPNGKFLIVNGNDIFDDIEIVWEQGVRVLPNNVYLFKFMYTNIDLKVDTNKNLPILEVSFDNEIFDTIYVPKPTCFWQTYHRFWNSKNKDSVTIRIRDLQQAFFGNDFAIDEISMKSLCEVQACAGENWEICLGDTVVLGDLTNRSALQGFKPYTFKWYPETDLSSPFVPNPLAYPKKTTTYYLEVTDSLGCFAVDSVIVIVHSPPSANITLNKGTPVCPCDSIILYATEGLKYHWSTGDTTAEITVNKPGYYSLLVQNPYGCTDTTGIYIDFYKVNTQLKIDTIDAEVGQIVTLPIKIANQQNFFACNYSQYEIVIEYDKTVLFPLNQQPNYLSQDRESIYLTGISSSEELEHLQFFVTLGKTDYSDVLIKTFRWSCDKVDVDVLNGRVNVLGVCREGGDRFVNFNEAFHLSQISPNPVTTSANVLLNFIEKGLTKVYIRNSIGEIVDVLLYSIVSPGKFHFTINAKELSSGLYYLIIDTPTQRYSQIFQIIK